MLGKNPTSVHNAITISQKKDDELHIIEGFHNHDPEHKINNISSKQYQSQNSNIGPCHGCSGPHLIKDHENSVCKRCKQNLDNHVLARCTKRKSPTKEHWPNLLYNISPLKNQPNGHNDPNLKCSVSTSKADHISELLEATKKMTKYFKWSYKNNKSHQVDNDKSYTHIPQHGSPHPDKHVCKTHISNDQANEITGQMQTFRGTKSEHEDTRDQHDSDSPDSNFDSSLDSEWLS